MSGGTRIVLDAGALADLPSLVERQQAQIDELLDRVAKLEAVRPETEADFVPLIEAARLRGCQVSALRKLVARGRIPHVRRGRAVLIARCHIQVA